MGSHRLVSCYEDLFALVQCTVVVLSQIARCVIIPFLTTRFVKNGAMERRHSGGRRMVEATARTQKMEISETISRMKDEMLTKSLVTFLSRFAFFLRFLQRSTKGVAVRNNFDVARQAREGKKAPRKMDYG